MQQLSIFDEIYEKYKITKPIRLIELFAGYGSQALALEFLGVNFEHYKICEFDKYAVQSYNSFHNTNFEPSDITKLHASDLNIVNTNKYEYILFYSFPCTDLSIAGKMQGMEKGKTRSGLLWEVERLLNECEELPQVLIMENVPPVLKAKGWEDWQEFLKNKGYKNFVKVLNAKDYYIPQTRQRCFMVSILEGQGFNFPKTMKLDYVLIDLLDENVDGKYFMSDDIEIKFNKKPNNDLQEPQLNQVATLNIKGQDIIKRVYDPNGLAPTLTTMQGGNRQPKILVNKPVCLNSKGGRKGIKGLQPSLQDRIYDSNAISPAITSSFMPLYYIDERVRRLTPSECYKIMGVPNWVSEKTPVSNSQQYKQAGNSIVTTVLMAIFGELLDIDWQTKVKELVNEMLEVNIAA